MSISRWMDKEGVNSLFKAFAEFFNWFFILFSYKSFLYTPDTSLFSDIMICAPPQFMVCLFIFLVVGVLMHTFNFHEVQFISFVGHAFHVQSKNSLPNPEWQRFSPVFFHFIPVSIIVFAVTFKCIVYFELIFNMMWGKDLK